MSCLISLCVGMIVEKHSHLGRFPIKLVRRYENDVNFSSGVAELVEAELVDSEVVRELVEHGDPDLPLELGGVRERLDERPPEDRDLVGHELVGLPQPEQVGV